MGKMKEVYMETVQNGTPETITPKAKPQPLNVVYLTDDYWQTNNIANLSKDMIKFNNDLSKINLQKDSQNGHLRNKYVSLDKLLNTIRPILAKNNLFVHQHLAGDFIITVLTHATGQYIGSKMPFYPMKGNNATNDLQKIGGGITYGRRYAISTLLQISTDNDDDAQSMPVKRANAEQPKQLPYLPKNLHTFAKKAYDRDGNFESVLKQYRISIQARQEILKIEL
tara:strand:+ start:360 stop:1034 length:675 start_codon:yes stop_codon:yes gene_type:complete